MQNRTFISNLKKGIAGRLSSLFNNPYKRVGLSWLKLKKLKHLPPGEVRQIKFLHKNLLFISPPELIHGVKEIFIDEIYKIDLPANPTVIDCGANIGLSIIYIKENYPQARVIAFEPDETNFKLLEENVKSFGYQNVLLRKEAIWIENTELQFEGSGSMSSKLVVGAANHTKKVKAIRLKELLSEKTDFLKIDIEGAEYAVLNDIKDALLFVDNLFVEYHGGFEQTKELSNMLALINDQGLSYYIKEAAPVFPTPFSRKTRISYDYDIQLNIFCFRTADFR